MTLSTAGSLLRLLQPSTGTSSGFGSVWRILVVFLLLVLLDATLAGRCLLVRKRFVNADKCELCIWDLGTEQYLKDT